MSSNSYTRGESLLDNYLAKLRASKANSFISDEKRRGRILDIGCGLYPYFLSITQFKERYGLDPSVDLKSVKDKNIKLIKSKVEDKKLPLENNFFDVVTMLAVFEHIDYDKLPSALSETNRVLKKNGILIITTPAPWADKLLHFMARFKIISQEEIHEHKHNHPKSKIEDIINRSGFKRENIQSGFFELGFNMWFVARK
jgi:ubiquinone/menaquinone biosynthesis C-methylase UbiE